MKTILSQPEQKERILLELLQESGSSALFDTDVRTPSSLVASPRSLSAQQLCLTYHHILQEHKDELTIFKNMIDYPTFLNEILGFAKDCAKQGITAKDLPVDTATEKELQRLLELALEFPLKEKDMANFFDKTVEEACALDLSIVEQFLKDPFEIQLVSKILERRPECAQKNVHEPAKKHSFFYAMSPAQEIEACAQRIAKKGADCTVVLCSPQAQMPLVRSVFTRYNIPFAALTEDRPIRAPYVFATLLNFAQKKDKDSYLACLRQRAFSNAPSLDLLPVLEELLTESDPFIPSLVQLPNWPDEEKVKQAQRERIASFFASIKKEVQSLLDAGTPAECLVSAYEVFRGLPLTQDQDELKVALKIRTLLNNCVDLVLDDADLRIVKEAVLSCGLKESGFDTVTIGDLTMIQPHRKTVYVLGATGRAWPGFPVRKGLFDESYVRKIQKFLSLEARHANWMNSLSWIERGGDEVVYSYCRNDYKGRSIQSAFQIEQTLGKPVPWPLETLTPRTSRNHSLKITTAQNLFLDRDNTVHGSVSRIERWFNCPYSYFLESGLKLSTPNIPSLQANSIGTIQHALMEVAAKEKGEHYAKMEEAEIRAFLKPWFKQLREALPNETLYVDLTEERMVKGFLSSFAFLRTMEWEAFKPEHEEYRFDTLLHEAVTLSGIIDRVDMDQEGHVRIIDYKSSEKSLSKSKIKCGLQLQLLTYTLIAAQSFKQEPDGCYYFSLKPVLADRVYAKYGFSKGCEEVNEEVEELVHKLRRFTGWAFEDKPSSKDFKVSPKSWDIETVEYVLQAIYTHFLGKVQTGFIPPFHTEGACTFCNYKNICRNDAMEIEPEPIVDPDEEEED